MATMEEFDQKIKQSFPLVAFMCNRHILDHMRRIRKGVGVDLDTALVWGITAHLNIARSMPPGTSPDHIMSKDGFYSGEMKPVRLRDISQVCELPRETVRRKLVALEELGKVQRTQDGGWIMCSTVQSEDVVDFTISSIRRFIETAKQIEQVLNSKST